MWYIHTFDDLDDLIKDSDDGVYTITENQNEPGWNTDGGYWGYGLTKERAQYIVDILNKHEQSIVNSALAAPMFSYDEKFTQMRIRKAVREAKKEARDQALEEAAKLIEDKFDFLGDELLASESIRALKSKEIE